MELPQISGGPPEPKYDIDLTVYDRSARVFRRGRALLGVDINLHGDPELIRRGHIFVFNHFARFETFIPQYLFYEAARIHCVSVAAGEFFAEDNLLSAYLRELGVVPNDYPRLLPWLAEQILRGRKVMIFPEGGMVKDRRVLERRGEYSVYSRTLGARRKLHTGAAVLALCLDLFKVAVRRSAKAGDTRRLDIWAESIGLESREGLLSAAREPTLIVPANITFHPLRVEAPLLARTAEFLSHGLSRRNLEELIIESNILLHDTDMDIRLGRPIRAMDCWCFGPGGDSGRPMPRIDSLDQAFAVTRDVEPFAAEGLRHCVDTIRDAYMREMYRSVTLNLSHLAATLIMSCLGLGLSEIDQGRFHRALYLAVQNVQRLRGVHLHHGLRNPKKYRAVITETHTDLGEFFAMAERCGLLVAREGHFHFLPKLRAEFTIDEIRMENPVAVYANEAKPVSGLLRAVGQALAKADTLNAEAWSNLRFGDELTTWRWDYAAYRTPEYAAANALETLTAKSGPFLISPRNCNGEGVLLIHELLACPATLRGLGEFLSDRGYLALGIRLEGHGTSPHDLDRTHWEDWLDSAYRAWAIVQDRVDRIHLVGAGVGGLLALHLAAGAPDRLAGVVALALPWALGTGNPLLFLRRSTRHLLRWISQRPGQPFTELVPEFPRLSYRQVPLNAIRELHALADAVEKVLPKVRCPVFLAQADDDPVLDSDSTRQVHEALVGTRDKVFRQLHGRSHYPVVDNLDGIRADIGNFLRQGVAAFPAAASTQDSPTE